MTKQDQTPSSKKNTPEKTGNPKNSDDVKNNLKSNILVSSLESQIKAREELQTNIQATLNDFMSAADTQLQNLVQKNTLGPDVTEDMIKLHKATIEKTLDFINASPVVNPPKKIKI